jgi:phage tail-like protein
MPVDPYINYAFKVEIQGIQRAGFKEVTGLDSTIDVIEYREGGDNTTTQKKPGMAKYSNIVLKRGVTEDQDLWKWHKQWIKGDPAAQRQDGFVVLYDRDGTTEKARWHFVKAWPTKWTGPSFNAEGKEIAIETLELAHEGIERA